MATAKQETETVTPEVPTQDTTEVPTQDTTEVPTQGTTEVPTQDTVKLKVTDETIAFFGFGPAVITYGGGLQITGPFEAGQSVEIPCTYGEALELVSIYGLEFE